MTPFQQKISDGVHLPSLARNIPFLMQALADDSLTYRQLADVIKQYPSVTARLIFLTNSPWSAPISPVTSIEQACARLGTSIVKSLSIAISIASSFDVRKCPDFSTEHFWTTAMLVSKGAGLLALQLPSNADSTDFVNTAQTAGLLHNLGLLWLADSLPKETEKALLSIIEDPLIHISTALQEHTGTDYSEVGGWIGSQMGFPDVLNIAIKYHHTANYQEASWKTTLLVGWAANMVSEIYQQTTEISTNSRLESLGIDASTQESIFQQLSNDFEATRDLAKTLF